MPALNRPELLWLAALWLVGVLALLWWGYRSSSLRGGKRLLAMTCKGLALILLALCLLDPVSVTEQPRRGANEIKVLLDDSRSLELSEIPESPQRRELLQQLVQSSSGQGLSSWLMDLSQAFRIRLQAVGQQVRAISSTAEMSFQGKSSALCSAVLRARERAGSAVAAVVLLTDGNATDAWPAVVPAGAPVFPVLLGQQAPAPDLSIVEARGTPAAFEDTPVSLEVRVAQTGFSGRSVLLAVLDEKGKLAASEQHSFGHQEQQKLFRLHVPSTQPGLNFFKVIALDAAQRSAVESGQWQQRASSGEATLLNNERTLAVDRGAGPYRILYVGGRPNWDYKFLRRALAKETQIQMPALIRVARQEPKFQWRGRAGESSNPLFKGFADQAEVQRYDEPVLTRLGTKDAEELRDGFPKTAELLMGYHGIILDDVEAKFFSQEQHQLLERYVSQRGGALLMLGSQDSFAPGGYEGTSVGRMLPVYLEHTAAAQPVLDAAWATTREGWLEPWLTLRAQRTLDELRQQSMPTFYAVNQAFTLKPGASVLATVQDRSGKAWPSLVTQRYGSGQVISMLIADLWRWGMQDATQHADMDQFWRQMLRAAVLNVPDRVQLSVQELAGQQRIQVRVRSLDYQPEEDAAVELSISHHGSVEEPLHAPPSETEPGVYEADYYPTESGAFRVRATVKVAQETLVKETGFAINDLAQEMAQLSPNRELLSRMAAETGGQLVSDVNELPALLKKLDAPAKERRSSPLWHHPAWLVLLVALLLAEWGLRRSQGWL